jgi:hypothetical protein
MLAVLSGVKSNKTYEDSVNSAVVNVLRRMNSTRFDFIIQFIGVYVSGWQSIEGVLTRAEASNDSTYFGCSESANPNRTESFITLVDVGGCSISDKINLAIKNGANGLVIRSNDDKFYLNKLGYLGKNTIIL